VRKACRKLHIISNGSTGLFDLGRRPEAAQKIARLVGSGIR
jgi:hypothetical protein